MKFVPNGLVNRVSLAALKAGKVSPTLMFAGGIAGMVGTAVLASRATLRLDGLLEETNQTLAGINEMNHKNYTEDDRRKDKATVFLRSSVKIFKLYAPSLAVGAITVGLLVGSHNILTKRNAALTAAYATIDKGFREYRSRVVDDLGTDKDRQYLYGVEEEKKTTTNAKGEVKTKKVTVSNGPSQYGRMFREGNQNWVPQNDHNLVFLKCQQNYANDRLQAKGYLFLSDVLDMLGMDRTPASQIVGWLAKGNGDGFVDFNIWDRANAGHVLDYVTGREDEIFLDFNVDGLIYDQI